MRAAKPAVTGRAPCGVRSYFGGDAPGTPPIPLDPVRRRSEFARALERLEGSPGDSLERFDRYLAASRAALDGGWPLAIEERWDWPTVREEREQPARSE